MSTAAAGVSFIRSASGVGSFAHNRFANKTLQILLTTKLGSAMIELQRKLGMEVQV